VTSRGGTKFAEFRQPQSLILSMEGSAGGMTGFRAKAIEIKHHGARSRATLWPSAKARRQCRFPILARKVLLFIVVIVLWLVPAWSRASPHRSLAGC